MTDKIKFTCKTTFIKWFKVNRGKELLMETFLNLTQTKSINEFLELGYSVRDIQGTLSKRAFELIFEQLNIDPIDSIGANLLAEETPLTDGNNSYSVGVFQHFVRETVTEFIVQYYGTMNAYSKTEAYQKRRLDKSIRTTQERYGVDNVGQLPEHKEKMAKGVRCENPFASNKFKLLDYIKGKRVLPNQLCDYELYKEKVLAITEKNRPAVKFNGTCYYTGQTIYKCYGKENIDRNS